MVPFDFSPLCMCAARHAAFLSGRLKSGLALWIVHDRFSEAQLGVPDEGRSTEIFRMLAVRRLEQLGSEFLQKYGVRIGYEWLEGKVLKTVELKVKSDDVSMLVLGVYGSKQQDALFQDFQANRIAYKGSVPVMAVKQSDEDPGYRRIALGLEIDNFNSREKIPYAVKLAEAGQAEVHILGMEKHHDSESVSHLRAIVAQAEKYFLQRDVRVRSEIRPVKSKSGDSVSFVKDVKADLLLVMAESEGPFGGLLGSSFPQHVAGRLEHPVLVIPPKVSTVTAQVTV